MSTFTCQCCGRLFETLEPPLGIFRSTIQLGRVFRWRNALGSEGEAVVIRWSGIDELLKDLGPRPEMVARNAYYSPEGWP